MNLQFDVIFINFKVALCVCVWEGVERSPTSFVLN